jgi:hypothetical protein
MIGRHDTVKSRYKDSPAGAAVGEGKEQNLFEFVWWYHPPPHHAGVCWRSRKPMCGQSSSYVESANMVLQVAFQITRVSWLPFKRTSLCGKRPRGSVAAIETAPSVRCDARHESATEVISKEENRASLWWEAEKVMMHLAVQLAENVAIPGPARPIMVPQISQLKTTRSSRGGCLNFRVYTGP